MHCISISALIELSHACWTLLDRRRVHKIVAPWVSEQGRLEQVRDGFHGPRDVTIATQFSTALNNAEPGPLYNTQCQGLQYLLVLLLILVYKSRGSALWRLQHNSREVSSFLRALCARSCALGLEICQTDCVCAMNIVLCMQSLRCHHLGRQSHELCSGTLSSQLFRALLASHMYLWTPSSGLSLYGGSRIKQTRTSPWKYIVPSDK